MEKLPIGTIRSLPPLPCSFNTRTSLESDLISVISLKLSPTISETLPPVLYRSSSIALFRIETISSSPVVPSINEVISATVKALGSLSGIFRDSTSFIGL